jgi:hypothetical protein
MGAVIVGHKNTEHHFSSGGNLEEIGFGHRQTSEENSGSGQSTIIDTRHPFFATQPEDLRAEEIIEAEAKQFISALGEGDLNDVIGAFRRQVSEMAFAEFERTRNRLGQLNEDQEQALRWMINAIVNRLTRPVINQLRESKDGHSLYLSAWRDLHRGTPIS